MKIKFNSFLGYSAGVVALVMGVQGISGLAYADTLTHPAKSQSKSLPAENSTANTFAVGSVESKTMLMEWNNAPALSPITASVPECLSCSVQEIEPITAPVPECLSCSVQEIKPITAPDPEIFSYGSQALTSSSQTLTKDVKKRLKRRK